MQEIKKCRKCGKIISDINAPDCDYYRHISVKYCPDCKPIVDRMKTANRMWNLRQRKKQRDKLRDEQLELLKQENELLRQAVQKLRERGANNE